MLYQWRDVMNDYQRRHEGETRILMSEAYGNDTIFKKYYHSADGLRQGSHMPFNFVLVSDVNENSTAADFKRVIDNRLEIVPKSRKTNWVMGNHDQPRVASRFGSQMVDALLTLVMTLPGMSVTYNVNCIQISFRSPLVVSALVMTTDRFRERKSEWKTFVLVSLSTKQLIPLLSMLIRKVPEMVGNGSLVIQSELHSSGTTRKMLDFAIALVGRGCQLTTIFQN